jgi:creatinine amidohydrolase
MTMLYGEHNWTQIPDLADRVVVLPLGSLEQHGHHLPLLTDTINCAEIARRAEEALGDTALFLPTVWVGASDHHLRFPGTVCVHNDTYATMLVDMLECLIGHGFKRIMLLNGHGGNGGPGSEALYRVQMRHRDERDLWLVMATWFALAAPQIAAIESLEQKGVTHACELETSLILHLRPELVRLDKARGAHEPFPSRFYNQDASRPSRVTVRRPFEHITATGALGHPEHATASKGQEILAVAVHQVVDCVREIAAWPPLEPN